MMLVCFMSVYLHIIVVVCFAPNEIIPDIIISRQFLRIRPISQEKGNKTKTFVGGIPQARPVHSDLFADFRDADKTFNVSRSVFLVVAVYMWCFAPRLASLPPSTFCFVGLVGLGRGGRWTKVFPNFLRFATRSDFMPAFRPCRLSITTRQHGGRRVKSIQQVRVEAMSRMTLRSYFHVIW